MKPRKKNKITWQNPQCYFAMSPSENTLKYPVSSTYGKKYPSAQRRRLLYVSPIRSPFRPRVKRKSQVYSTITHRHGWG